MTISPRLAGVALALTFLTLHLPFLPRTLEDLDSINFALAIRDFDVARHQPHPPGYPIFVVAAKLVRVVTPSEATALSLMAVLAGAASVFALLALYRRLDPDPGSTRWSFFATVLATTTPLFWFTAARPLSDTPGLAAAVGVQALTIGARTSGLIVLSAFLAALAAGIRSQIVWLTVPLLALAVLRRPVSDRRRVATHVLLALVAGGLTWLLPMVWLTGGPGAYWRALSNQGAEDLSGVVMLWTTPTLRQFLRALNAAFVAPWVEPPIAALVSILAVVGLLRLSVAARPTLMTLAAAFGPYLVFDFLFQETVSTRYALPLVVPMAYLAVRGLDAPMFLQTARPRISADSARSSWRRPQARLIRATILAGLGCAGLVVAGRALYWYSSGEAPAFTMLEEMRTLAVQSGSASGPPVLAMHRRQDFDLRRPMLWLGDRMPSFARLPSPPKREWLELVNFWNSGGRRDVWFLADPLRSDLALVDDPVRQSTYRWPLGTSTWSPGLLTLLGGLRPSEADWYVIRTPGWYLGEGWALTPETAGVAREAGLGPGRGPIHGWIRRRPDRVMVMVGGRNLSAAGLPAQVRLAIDGRLLDEVVASPGFFLNVSSLPPGALAGTGDYARLEIEANPVRPEPASAMTPSLEAPAAGLPAVDVAIEQFDAESEGTLVFGFADGWHELEYDPRTGRLWRWTSEQATIRVAGAAGVALALRIGGEVEAAARSHVTIRAGGRVVSVHDIGRRFLISAVIPAELLTAGDGEITIETDQTYVPAEERWRSGDRRRLGLKVLACTITAAS